jgi:hypothetical protein
MKYPCAQFAVIDGGGNEFRIHWPTARYGDIETG